MHAGPIEMAALVSAATRHGAPVRDATSATRPPGCSTPSTRRSPRSARPGDGARLQVSHLKCGSRTVWGRADEAVGVLEAARAEGLDVAADQYPYTAAATTLAIVLPPALLGLGVEECVAALGDQEVRFRVREEMDRGHLGLGERGRRPRLVRASASRYAASHPDWAGRSLADIAEELGAEPADLAFDALMDDRLDVSVVIDCMDEADVETIMAVPWIAVCTDAEGRRPGHPILDAGRPHPRTYGSTARVLGTYVRDRGTLSLETAVAKLTSVPAARARPARPRDRARRVASPTSWCSIRRPSRTRRPTCEPARHPTGIDHVVVNGQLAVRDGEETGQRPGRLLRRGA